MERTLKNIYTYKSDVFEFFYTLLQKLKLA